MIGLSVLIIVHNEVKNIRACLEGVKWADEIIIVDAKSNDGTIDICREYTDKIYMNSFKDFSTQKNFALSKATHDWVLFIDADEVVTDALRNRIVAVFNKTTKLDGYFIKRDNYIFGKILHYGGHDKDFQMRLFKREGAVFYQPIHEKISLKSNKMGRIEEPLLHFSTKDINDYIRKLNLYTDLECEYMLSRKKAPLQIKIFIIPQLKFLKRYIIQKGFLDGIEGFIFYLLSAFYDFLKHAKYFQHRKTKAL